MSTEYDAAVEALTANVTKLTTDIAAHDVAVEAELAKMLAALGAADSTAIKAAVASSSNAAVNAAIASLATASSSVAAAASTLEGQTASITQMIAVSTP